MTAITFPRAFDAFSDDAQAVGATIDRDARDAIDLSIARTIVHCVFNPSVRVPYMLADDKEMIDAGITLRKPKATPDDVLGMIASDTAAAVALREKALNYAIIRAVYRLCRQDAAQPSQGAKESFAALLCSDPHDQAYTSLPPNARAAVNADAAVAFLAHVAAGAAYADNKDCFETIAIAQCDLPGASYEAVAQYVAGAYPFA